ncbi:MAG: hypothetical protein ACK5V2_01625, partial [Pseudomonadota bacterium]
PTTTRFLPQAGNARAADAVGTPALQGQRMADWAPASAQRVRGVETVAIAAVMGDFAVGLLAPMGGGGRLNRHGGRGAPGRGAGGPVFVWGGII